ncbi:hypothetical protein [Pseudomonas sp. W2-17]|uniref:hypothetical protein n=1 Tax=Pseudomonas sp. W2-17 TaxID=3058039 RepID=UPI0034E062AF
MPILRTTAGTFIRNALLTGLVAAMASGFALSASARETVRIGYQKSSTLITLLKTQGTLEEALGKDNIDITWIKSHPREAAQVLGPLWGNLDVETVEAANAHRSYQVEPVKADQLGEQQKIADAFFKAGLLPTAVDAKDVDIWTP